MTTAPEKNLRVLIVRLGAMGDILHAMPAVQALRCAHPDWFLGWAIEPRWVPLLCGTHGKMPLVDRVHRVNAKVWARSPLRPRTVREIAALRRELRSERYDAAVDLQGAVRSALVGRLSAAPRMLGEDSPRERLARWFFKERVGTTGVHVIEQAVEVCRAIGGDDLQPLKPRLPVDEEADAWAEQLLHSDGDSGKDASSGCGKRQVVVLSPGAGWGAKCWPAERYGELAATLNAAGCLVFVNAGPREQPLAAKVAEKSGGVALALECSIEQMISLLRRADLLIGGDSGPLHLACALGKPVVGIFGPTDPGRNGPFATRFRVLRHPESKRDHTRRSRPEAGLLTISAGQVFEAASELLGI